MNASIQRTRIVRLLKERLGGLRQPVIQSRQSQLQTKAFIARMLRGNCTIRHHLNLPLPDALCWKPWLESYPEQGFEIPIDPERHLHLPLPEGSPLAMDWLFRQEADCFLQASFVAGIYGGKVWNHHGGVYFSRQGDLLWDLGREHWLDICVAGVPAAMSRWHLPRPKTLSGTVAVLASPDAFSNFGHWCLDILPKINLLQRAGWQPDSIDFYFVGHTQKEFQLQSLAAAGIPLDKVVQMKSNETLRADLLLMPFLNSYHFTSFQPSTINYLRNLYGSLSSAPRFSGGPERIFISRSDASFRRVSNEPELRQVLEPLGFHFIALGGCSLQETADIMSNARIVVSPNGSGLVSVLFANPGCFVLEFSHPRYTTTFHWKLCCAAALRYAHLVSDDEPVSKGAEQRLLYADLTISPSRLLGALDQAGVL